MIARFPVARRAANGVDWNEGDAARPAAARFGQSPITSLQDRQLMDSRLGSLGASLVVFLGLRTLLWSLNPTHAQDAAIPTRPPRRRDARRPSARVDWPQVPDHVKPQTYYPSAAEHRPPLPLSRIPATTTTTRPAGFREPRAACGTRYCRVLSVPGRHRSSRPSREIPVSQPASSSASAVGYRQPMAEQLARRSRSASRRYNSHSSGTSTAMRACRRFGYGFGVGGFGGF